jgi:FkbM family methyltransferase
MDELDEVKRKARVQGRALHKHQVALQLLATTDGLARALDLANRLGKSQIGQDIFAIWATNGLQDGFFVEFGALDGTSLSNTHVLEKHFGWTGVLAEPNPRYWDDLEAARKKSFISHECVWSTSGEELSLTDAGVFTSISTFATNDKHADKRAGGEIFTSRSVSLQDLLDKYHAPLTINFMSIDTEGSELEIINAYDFQGIRRIESIAVEHNHSAIREPIKEILLHAGYLNVFPDKTKHDDWFVLPDLFASRNTRFDEF